jgi:hypothetical protein
LGQYFRMSKTCLTLDERARFLIGEATLQGASPRDIASAIRLLLNEQIAALQNVASRADAAKKGQKDEGPQRPRGEPPRIARRGLG